MSYWEASPPLLINQDIAAEILENDIVFIDGGSRDALFSPVNQILKNSVLYAFDPSPEPNEYTSPISVTHIPYALWRETGSIDLNVAVKPGTSSVYPPDYEMLKKFNSRVGWQARKTVEKIKVTSKSIDDAVSHGLCAKPDFIKLDIHAAEFEALEGAVESLESTCGILVETWHHPIHTGQHLHGELEFFLNQKGFFLYDMRKASSWSPVYNGRELSGRRVSIGTESLFIKESAFNLNKKMLILEMFGFYASALEVATQLREIRSISEKQFESIENFIIRKSDKEKKKQNSFFVRISNRLAKLVNEK